MQPTFDGAAHVTHGDSAGGGVRDAGAVTLRVVRDLLTYGPCDADPARHVPLRLRHWGLDAAEAPGFSLTATVDGWPPAQPIVLWATRAWSDQLFLWWTLDALARAQIDPARLWWAAPRTQHPLASSGAADRPALAAALAAAQPVTSALVEAARALWRSFASPSPLLFDEARRAGVAALPDLDAIAAPHGGWFPWLVDGKLRLAELDQVLLTHADRPIEQNPPELLLPHGDRLVRQRREQWGGRGALTRTANGWTISDAGRRLVDAGLDTVAAAPEIFVGGCRINDPARPWLRLPDAAGWQLAAG